MRSIFSLRQCQRNLVLLFSRYKTLSKTQINTRVFHLYCWNHVCKVIYWSLVDCFRREYRVSTQIKVRDCCMAICKSFSVCGVLLMALRPISFAIQNIHVNLNPVNVVRSNSQFSDHFIYG